METLVASSVNFIILVWILFHYMRKPTREFIANRHAFIRDEVVRVEGMLRSAQARYEEFSAKLKAMDAEIQSLRTQTNQDAEAARLRIEAEAKRLSIQVAIDARSSSESIFADLKSDLSAKFANSVLTRTEELLRQRLTGDERIRIRREFSRQVESLQ